MDNIKSPTVFRWLLATGFFLLSYFHDAKCDENNPLIISTNECQLTEPVYGHKFDFSALRSDLAHTAIGDKQGDIFEYNICGNLTRSCDGRNNVAACLRRGNKEFVLGTQHVLNYRQGKMYFNFSGGAKCPTGDGPLQLHVFIGCDYILDTIQSRVTSYANNACSFYIRLETPHACLPQPDEVKSNKCSVTDPSNGHTYDLQPLSDSNYRTTDRNGSAFVINICKPVLYAENAMCPPGSAICFFNITSNDYKNKFINYGTVQSNPVIENGALIMRHKSNTRCNATENYSSTILFYCDRTAKNAQPSMVGFHGCVYEFSFITPLACNDLPPCTTITQYNEIIDLNPLQNKPFTLQLQDKSYTFGVCSHAGSPCLENDGACLSQNGQSTSLGTINSHLRVSKTGPPYLLYDGGAVCQKSDDAAAASNSPASSSATTYWSTKIEFICANNATKDNGSAELGPKIIENSHCQLLIHYQTPLACQEQIDCKFKAYVEHSEDGSHEEIVDLTPLISTTENYEAQINLSSTETTVDKSAKFYLNVCRPLVPKYGLGCPGGSAACMAKVSPAGLPEEEQSLGYPTLSLSAINRTAAQLLYLQGGPCPTDKNMQLSSRIHFFCDLRAGLGTPVLKTISDCEYGFVWATNVFCPAHMCNFNADTCEIINDEINVSYNLKKAPFTDEGKIKIHKDKAEFTLDICGPHRKAVTDYSQSLVNVFFAAKGPCGVDGTVNVQMRLICSSDNEGATSFSDDTQCDLIYVQRTPDICKFLGLAVPSKPTPATSTAKPNTVVTTEQTNNNTGANGDAAAGSEHPAEHTGSIGAILAGILSLTFFIACFGVLAFSPERRNSIRRLFRRNRSSVRYSRVQSNEEANLLLEPNGEFTDSDDDMLL